MIYTFTIPICLFYRKNCDHLNFEDWENVKYISPWKKDIDIVVVDLLKIELLEPRLEWWN